MQDLRKYGYASEEDNFFAKLGFIGDPKEFCQQYQNHITILLPVCASMGESNSSVNLETLYEKQVKVSVQILWLATCLNRSQFFARLRFIYDP